MSDMETCGDCVWFSDGCDMPPLDKSFCVLSGMPFEAQEPVEGCKWFEPKEDE